LFIDSNKIDKVKFGWIENVCVIDSMHAFLQYLLLVSESVVRNTFFFWGEGISSDIKKKFEGHYADMDKKKKEYNWIKFLYKYPFLLRNDIQYWGHDHLPWSKYIIRKHSFFLLEDGLMNYNSYILRSRAPLKRRLLALWEGPLSLHDIPYSGYEQNCKKIYLTGILDTGEVYTSTKLMVKSFKVLWDECDDDKRSFINHIFDFDEKVCEELRKRKKVLLTQPFSEDGFLTEKEKISVYSKVIDVIGGEDVVIKRHPRETTDYHSYFPNVMCFDKAIPMQLIMLNGIRFEEAYTIFSSAVFGFPYKIRIGFIGSQISSKLLNRFPSQTYNDYHCTDDNMEKIDIKLENVCD